jgi:hypothetical protein
MSVGVKTGGGSGGRILRRTELVRGYLASRISSAFPFVFSTMVPAIGFYGIFWPAVSDSLDSLIDPGGLLSVVFHLFAVPVLIHCWKFSQ